MAKKPVKKMAAGGSFSEAFRAARKGGEKTFTWKGKSYTTELAGEKPAAKPAAKASTPAAKPAAKPAGFGSSRPSAPGGFAGTAPKKDKPEAPSSGQANRSAYKAMMAESDAIRSKESQKTSAGRAVDFLAKGDPKTRGLPAGKRFSAAFNDSMRSDAPKPKPPAKTVIDLNPFPSKGEAETARAKATATRNKVTGRPGQALKRGGKVKKKYM